MFDATDPLTVVLGCCYCKDMGRKVKWDKRKRKKWCETPTGGGSDEVSASLPSTSDMPDPTGAHGAEENAVTLPSASELYLHDPTGGLVNHAAGESSFNLPSTSASGVSDHSRGLVPCDVQESATTLQSSLPAEWMYSIVENTKLALFKLALTPPAMSADFTFMVI